jgi:hypothetical protein
MSAREADRYLEFVYLKLFERTRKGVLTDEEMRDVEHALLADPETGATMGDSAGVRKIRAAQENRGKSGSARVVYLYVAERETIYFIVAFAKNVQGNLNDAQRRLVREVVGAIRSEAWPLGAPP